MQEKEEKINKVKAVAFDRILEEIESMMEFEPSPDILVLNGMVTAINWIIKEIERK